MGVCFQHVKVKEVVHNVSQTLSLDATSEKKKWLVHCLPHESCNYLCASVCVSVNRGITESTIVNVNVYLQIFKYTAVIHSLKDVIRRLKIFSIISFSFFFSFLLLTPQINKHSRQHELLPGCSFPIWATTCGTNMKCCWSKRTRLLQDPNNKVSSCCFWPSIRCSWKSCRSLIRTLTHTNYSWAFLLHSMCQIFSFEYHCPSECFIVFLTVLVVSHAMDQVFSILNKVEIKSKLSEFLYFYPRACKLQWLAHAIKIIIIIYVVCFVFRCNTRHVC